MFFRYSVSHVIILLVYVDAILVIESNAGFISKLMTDLNVYLSLKDLSDVTYFLEVQIIRCCDNFYLRQEKYVLELLERVEMTDCKPISIPIVTNFYLSLYD